MTWEIDQTHSSVRWQFTLWGIVTLSGPFRNFSGQLEIDDADPAKGSIDATVTAPSFDVKDFRMHARVLSNIYLDAYDFPAIKFKSTKIRPTGEGTFDVIGDLTLKETTKQVEMHTKYNGDRTDEQGRVQRGYSGDIEINWKEFLKGPPPGRSDSTGGMAKVHMEILAVKK